MSKMRMSLAGDDLARIITVRGAITVGLLDEYFERRLYRMFPSVCCADVVLA